MKQGQSDSGAIRGQSTIPVASKCMHCERDALRFGIRSEGQAVFQHPIHQVGASLVSVKGLPSSGDLMHSCSVPISPCSAPISPCSAPDQSARAPFRSRRC